MEAGVAQDQAVEVEFTLNGDRIHAEVDGKQSLMRYLRDECGLMGTKDGCSSGDCGTCVVLVDGKPVDSCVYLMRRAKGVEIETIDGLAEADGTLHPIQAAFLDRGAVQCGFCIPGMIMATKALLARNPNPDEDAIREGLKDNICRCTGFMPIFDAVKQAAAWLQDEDAFEEWSPKYGPMGTSSVLLDGHLSVQGKLPYADDLTMEGMLHGKVVWSEHPYARILSLDTGDAEKAEGVHSVITHADVPGLNAHGRTVPDQPVFCHDYVRFTGDPIALVLADSREQAEAAAELVRVEYEVLPGLYDPRDSLAPDAPQLVESSPGNVCKALTHVVGDVDAALAQAPHVVEGHFTTQRQDHAYLEPFAALANVDEDGTVIVRTPQQAPFETREQLTKVLDLPREKIRIVSTPIGGGFGGKLEVAVEGMIAVAAYVTRRPVKLTLGRDETLRTGVKRHPFICDYRVGMDDDGRLLAVDATMICDGGPYTGNSPRVIDQAAIFSCGPYRVPNVRIDGKAVLTNNPLGGAFRGYGINQAAVAMEQLMDELAAKLGLDPFELRRVNMLVEGDETITGQQLPSSVGAIPTLEACKKAFDEEWLQYKALERPGYRVGWGVAAGYKNVGAGKGKIDDAGATFRLKKNGRIALTASVIDMGQAIRTTMVQLASESTGLPFSLFDLTTSDTALVHPHRSASGQRQTLVSGNAVVIAGREFKQQLLALVGRWFDKKPEELAIVGDEIRTQWTQYVVEEKLISLAEVYARAKAEGSPLATEAEYVAPQTWPLSDQEARRTVPKEKYRNYPTYAYATQVAIVGVDEETGRVDLLRVIAAHDVGVAINPQQIRGQIIGSVSMGQGLALSENYPSVDGTPPWKRLDYRRLGVPVSTNATPVRVEIVEDPFPEGPYGAKGISEIATVPSTPAILNAVYDATGVRTYDLPVDPKLLKERMSA
ncbi:MAG TPA: molybdopterin cofactor-binding domain-containing protein [Gaiellaceae bacterium]|nr:molybdopterin cofactor-binding domain-containing protein [Gaiellaceae bacterium]